MHISFQPPQNRRPLMPPAKQQKPAHTHPVRFGLLEDLIDKDVQGTVELGGNLQNLTSSIYREGGNYHSIKARQDIRLRNTTVDQIVNAEECVRIDHCPKIARVRAGENVKLSFAPSVGEVHAKGHVDIDNSTVEGDVTNYGFAQTYNATIQGKMMSNSLQGKQSHFGLVHTLQNAELKKSTVPGLVEVGENFLAEDCPELGNIKVGEALKMMACPNVGNVSSQSAEIDVSTLKSLNTTNTAVVKESRILDRVLVQGGNMELRNCPELGEVSTNASYNYIAHCPNVKKVETGGGFLNLESSTIKGTVITKGDTQLNDTVVEGRLNVRSNNLVLNLGSVVNDIDMSPAFFLPQINEDKQPLNIPTTQIIRIAGNSVVKGDIDFKYGHGRVLLQKGSRVEGHVFGGTLEEVERL